MRTPIETIKSNDERFTAEIFQDDDPMNPREDWDNAGTMVCFHRRYNLGDKHDYKEPRRFLEALAFELDPESMNDPEASGDPFDYAEDKTNNELLEIIGKHATILPLYLYDHSGITISTGPFSCPWDSGQVGWIYITNDKMKKEGFDCPAEEVLNNEVKSYDQYLRGDVYGYVIEDEDENELDSCWGFFGMEDITEEVTGILKRYSEDVSKFVGAGI